MTPFYQKTEEGYRLFVHLQPGAKENKIVGLHGNAIKIRLLASPVEGKANQALIDFLASKLSLSSGFIYLVGGPTSREKTLLIKGVKEDSLKKLIPE